MRIKEVRQPMLISMDFGIIVMELFKLLLSTIMRHVTMCTIIPRAVVLGDAVEHDKYLNP